MRKSEISQVGELQGVKCQHAVVYKAVQVSGGCIVSIYRVIDGLDACKDMPAYVKYFGVIIEEQLVSKHDEPLLTERQTA